VKACGSAVKFQFLIKCGLISGIKTIRNVIPRMTIKFDRRYKRVRIVHTTMYCWSLKYVTLVLFDFVRFPRGS